MPTEERFTQVAIEDEMRLSYLDYAMSVIVGRALPDVRDGLKPVHRRILYGMNQMGLAHNRAYRKSAKIVGEIMGNYHPHGDSAIYDTLVRMAQDFNMRYTLVDGQGNYGSVDGDPPAAMRYTEARLTKLAGEMLADIEKETVDFGPTYDESDVEPLVLPAKVPNLLINGAGGIAVGYATNIPTHNLGEVVTALLYTQGRILFRAIGEFSGQRSAIQGAFPADEILRLPGGFASPGRVHRFADDPFGHGRIFFEVRPEPLIHGDFDDSFDFAVAQLGFGLPLELRGPHFDADHRRKALSHVVARERVHVLFQEIVRTRIGIDRPGQGGLEPDQMGSPFSRIDVVGKGEEVFGIAVVVLERDFQDDVRLFNGNKNRFVDRGFGFIQMFDERNDTALVTKDLFLLTSFVGKGDRKPFIEEGQFPKALSQHVETAIDRLENRLVGFKRNLRPPFFGHARHLKRGGRGSPVVELFKDLPVLPDFQLQPFGQRVDHGDAHAMESSGHGVGALLKLSACVEDGQGDFGRGLVLGGMEPRGNAPAIVRDRDTPIDFQRNLDRLPIARHVFIDTVVHDLVHEMMEPVRARTADVHGGSFPNGLQAFEYTDLLRTIPALFDLFFGETGGIKTRGRRRFVRQGLRVHLLVKHANPVYIKL